MNIDHDAPLHAKKEIEVAAPREQVWSLLTEIEHWHEWQPNVSSAKLEGDLAVGTTFRWKANGLGIKSTIQELEQGQKISWTGTSLGMKAVHLWTLEAQDNGTKITTEESLSGWFARILKIFSPKFLENSLKDSLQVIKTQAERQYKGR